MPALTKSKTVKKRPAKRAAIKRAAKLPSSGIKLRSLPPARGTVGDLLNDVEAGTFLKGADLELIERAYKSRSSRRLGVV